MMAFKGDPVVDGRAEGAALVTRYPINFSAAFSKPANLLPGRRSEIQDRHHDLFGHKIKGKILVFPAKGVLYVGRDGGEAFEEHAVSMKTLGN